MSTATLPILAKQDSLCRRTTGLARRPVQTSPAGTDTLQSWHIRWSSETRAREDPGSQSTDSRTVVLRSGTVWTTVKLDAPSDKLFTESLDERKPSSCAMRRLSAAPLYQT